MTSGPVRILVVDDDEAVRESAAEWLSLSGFETRTACDGSDALSRLAGVDIVLTDVRMPGIGGIELLASIRKAGSDVSVVMMTGHGDVPLAVEAMRAGAEDFIEKPCPADALVERIRRVAERGALRRELARLRSQLDGLTGLEKRWPGSSPEAVAVRSQLSALGNTQAPVLITGPQGSGKATAARLLHELSIRKGPLVFFDCAAEDEDMGLSLFGGTTYASPDGVFRDCRSGTVILSDAERLPQRLQTRLAVAMRDRTVVPDGGTIPVEIDTRIIVTTTETEALLSEVRKAAGSGHIALTPLHQRPGDIIPLYLHLIDKAAVEHDRPAPVIAASDLAALLAKNWAGNLSALKSDAEARVLGLETESSGQRDASLADLVRDFERRLIERALVDHKGNQAAAARALKLPRRTLGEKIAKLGIETSRPS